ncbi:UNVERIFIED_CONTAM: hypothetical protein HDU68_006994 [Siphonaria sp. JEL0065]|nr:hypothetical protein HDU68_006994 [Siphonaria sp. JEL0065]
MTNLSLISVLFLAAVASAQNRCGVSWEAANSVCGSSCVFPDAPCPSGQTCFAGLDQAVCSGVVAPAVTTVAPVVIPVVTTTAAAVVATGVAADPVGTVTGAAGTVVTGAVSGNEAINAAIAVVNQLPACAVPCFANGATAVDAQVAQQLCAAFSANQLDITKATTCLAAQCSAEQAAASVGFLTTNAGQLISACKALAPTVAATVSGAVVATASSGLAVSTTSPAASSNSTTDDSRVPWNNALFIIGLTVALVLFAFCICLLLCCCNRKNKRHDTSRPAAPAPGATYV